MLKAETCRRAEPADEMAGHYSHSAPSVDEQYGLSGQEPDVPLPFRML